MNPYKTAVFIDGENLVMRYQAMLKDGAEPRPPISHRMDEFVWTPAVFHDCEYALERVSYYTSASGDDDHLNEVIDVIQRNPVWDLGRGQFSKIGSRLNARVFKKKARAERSRLVDIHITLDSLRAAYRHDIDQILFISGDGDFLPVIEEIMRNGKRVVVSALSSGLAPGMKRVPDHFISLDNQFFGRIKKEA